MEYRNVEEGARMDNGRILKEMRLPGYNNFSGKDGCTIVGVEINPSRMHISVHHLLGNMPNVEALFKALLADKDVRDLIREYQKLGRSVPYRIWRKDASLSNRQEWFNTIAIERGAFCVTKTRKLLAISGFGKLTEEEDVNMSKGMYIGDFVELAVAMDFTKTMDVATLREDSKVEYVAPRLMEELLFNRGVTKLL